MSKNAVGCTTRQGIDYANTKRSEDYGEAWVVDSAKLSALRYSSPASKSCVIDRSKTFDASLIFGAGINASNNGLSTGTMQRTKNIKATTDYNFFVK
ncbi:MAG: hypothetical protein QS721_07125 [Candidatus Endonucleobacter sp. (ex Gigantidas childressi)]|nr:hypothetical protein [Candidatus Endonucleobacter sp. (ex Gigantidas childressi)]